MGKPGQLGAGLQVEAGCERRFDFVRRHAWRSLHDLEQIKSQRCQIMRIAGSSVEYNRLVFKGFDLKARQVNPVSCADPAGRSRSDLNPTRHRQSD